MPVGGVCKFFLQGSCWYGDSCRFKHPRNAYSGGEFGQQQNRFAALTPVASGQPNQGSRSGGAGGAGGAAATNVKDLPNDEIVNIISQEMLQWEQSNMWQFSCFSYTKESPCLPGLEDMSHEEVRLKAYEAQKDNTFDSYKQWIEQLSNEYKAKKKELTNPSPQMRLKLQQVIDSIKAATPGCATSANIKGTFGAGPGFGAPTTSQFSGATGDGAPSQPPLFGSNPSNAAFVGSPSTNPNTGLFGATGSPGSFSGSTFGGSSAGTGLFGKPATTTNSVFGGGMASEQQNTGLFGKPAAASSSQAAFGGAQPIFGGSSGTFGGSAPGAFGATALNLSSGSAMQNASGAVMQNQAVTQNIFGGGTPNTFGSATPSTFGSAPTSFGGPTHATQPSDSANTVYTPMDKLTKEEREQFEAATFTLGRIPTRPPPRELV